MAKKNGSGKKPLGIIRELSELPPGTPITINALAEMLGRHPVSVKRAIKRKELPIPTKLHGKKIWISDSIVQHIAKRQEEEARKAKRQEERLNKLKP